MKKERTLGISGKKRAPVVIAPTKLLVVDDDENSHRLLALLAPVMDCVVASTRARALAIIASPEILHALVTEVRLKDGSGLDLLHPWTETRTEAPILVVTAHHAEWRAANAAAERGGRFLSKPFAMGELLGFATEVHAHRWGLPRSVAHRFVPFVTRHGFTLKRVDLFARFVRKDPRKQIAADLGIALYTVKTRRRQLLQKIGVTTLERAYEQMMRG